MTDIELAWLAGLLEGEGSFQLGPPSSPNMPTISIEMTDEDVIHRVATLFAVSYVHASDRRPGEWKPSFSVRLRGGRAVGLMSMLRPLMGTRRQEQISEVLATYVDRRPGDNKRKLIPEQAAFIRSSKQPTAVLARQLGVSRDVVRKIRIGKIWKQR